jgi:hypothetical protein
VDDDVAGPRKNPFAIPYAALVADSEGNVDQQVVLHPHQAPPTYDVGPHVGEGADGDGD